MAVPEVPQTEEPAAGRRGSKRAPSFDDRAARWVVETNKLFRDGAILATQAAFYGLTVPKATQDFFDAFEITPEFGVISAGVLPKRWELRGGDAA